ncbi:indolepyruvate ferredoxin oxidoreductase subunit alpha [Desulfonatronovibrio hydrogenovorans]|uniref:indolepyruvate ferredoxin oxidoreductase subunit alpha n=1 Tax=Desulfonatronovibrio hydrogenovorans TaxID=53245 RepID=UPI00048F968E|nr:indolepyruvate ferredoxin oxidoreductase subunit alpha [Desulfonatronovibrio hydrogenovorans]
MNLLDPNAGAKELLLGNEAIVRGALEAGVGFISCYPGTPSSEVPDTFFRLSAKGEYYFEYAPNEKVAMETAGAAALGGVPTLVTMKHVGVNVAADPMMTLAYIGTPGGLVILSADDPGCHSSQNEQDNRYYARLAGLPCFEPSTAQECKDMTREVMELSAKWEQPVLLRTTTRVNHLRGPVDFGPMKPAKTKGEFKKDPGRFVPIPAVARIRHKVLTANLEKIRDEIETSRWNRIFGHGNIGVIASGVARSYLKDVLKSRPDFKVKVLELGIAHPLPQKMVETFLKDLDKVVILEELEPILENDIRVLCQKKGLGIEVMGKGEDLPLWDEFSTLCVEKALARATGLKHTPPATCSVQISDLPNRPPNLCAGCSHRSVYVNTRKIFGDDAVYSSDIGCYTLGILPPLKAADFLLCMGSSVSSGCGMSRVIDNPVVAFIGDSTFFHSGITGLINAVYNDYDLILVILDNRTTAMTGHQPHPGVDQALYGLRPGNLEIEPLVRASGVEQIRKVKALNQKAVSEALMEFKSMKGVRVLIAEEPCPLYAKRVLGVKRSKVGVVKNSGQASMDCLNTLACPAFYMEEGNVRINPDTCAGCMVCVQICDEIKPGSRS